MPFASIPKRLVCVRCQRPQSTCICQWSTAIQNQVEVLILQHPLELNHAKGSARLLHLSLRHSRLQVGETFAEQELQALLHQPWTPALQRSTPPPAHRAAVLLYPDSPGMPPPPPLDSSILHEPQRLRLIVLDGTWRKSRKMLFRNPLLQQLPRLSLSDAPASRYRIRQAHRRDQLSTLEATCHALMRIEGTGDKYPSLLRAFDGFVAQQLGYRQRSLAQDSGN